MNHVVLVGRLTKDPDLRYIPGEGTPVVNFTLAINRGYKKEGKSEADFIFVEAWNKQAENIAQYCMKGSLIGVQGSIRVETYMHQEQKRSITKVRANQVEFLSSNNNNNNNSEGAPTFTPSFEAPQGLDPNGFQAIDDDEIPF